MNIYTYDIYKQIIKPKYNFITLLKGGAYASDKISR